MSDTPEVVERVAEAIFNMTAPEEAKPWRIQIEPSVTLIAKHYRKAARAAIKAMLEPTPKMLNAAAKAMSPAHRPTPSRVGCREKHKIRYQAMIDAALGVGK